MDPSLDPPPLSAPPTAFAADAPPPVPVPAAVNPGIPAHPVPVNHPSYAQMITAAIAALNERDGSSKRAISKYIETHYPSLPPNHSVVLTTNLQRLKTNGQLVMVKKSYALPSRSTAAAAVNGVPAPSSSKRRPGRPPKPKPDAGQAAVPVFPTPPAHIALAAPVRGRGRPPKRGGAGRPSKKTAVVAPTPAAKGSGRPRGRPPKPVNVVDGAAAAPVPAVGGKRRGRPPKAGGVAKKPRNMTAVQPRRVRKLSGKPLGRPKKNALASTNQTSDSSKQLLEAFLKLKSDHEDLQKKVKETANVIRPSLNNDAAIYALNELQVLAERAPDAQVPSQQPQPQS